MTIQSTLQVAHGALGSRDSYGSFIFYQCTTATNLL